ncbi:MAG TPA: hypothetical protein VM431_06290 [Phycisphaerae bacterium]|nr:hypothetical protein [Phycisphaerae bacterium]
MTPPDYTVGGPDGPHEVTSLAPLPHQDKQMLNRRPQNSKKRRPSARGGRDHDGPNKPAPAERDDDATAPPDGGDPHVLDALA